MSRILITGAPGAGKTTLLLALQARGYLIVGDTARTIIQDRRKRGLSPRPDPYAFAQELLRMDIENFGSCTLYGECMAACPKEISIDTITRMNGDFLRAAAQPPAREAASAAI